MVTRERTTTARLGVKRPYVNPTGNAFAVGESVPAGFTLDQALWGDCSSLQSKISRRCLVDLDGPDFRAAKPTNYCMSGHSVLVPFERMHLRYHVL